MKSLGDDLVGNVQADFRIDGWLEGRWYQGDNESLVHDSDTFMIRGNRTLTIDLEDGRVSSKYQSESKLGFICQALETAMEGSKDCSKGVTEPASKGRS